MRQHELQRGGRQADLIAAANLFDFSHFLPHLRTGRPIVVFGVFHRAGGQNTAIKPAPDHHRGVARFTQRQEVIQRVLFQQGVAPGQQEAVKIALLQRSMAYLPFVYPHANRLHHAFIAQLRQCTVGAFHRLAEIVWLPLAMGINITIMNKRNVDAFQRQALQAVFDRTHRAVVAVIKHRLKRQRLHPYPGVDFRPFLRLEQTPDLGRQHKLIARIPAQPVPDARFA